MLTPQFLRSKFDDGSTYDDYVRSGKPEHQPRWNDGLARVHLSPAERAIVASFTRSMPVIVTSGTWCGDCVAQCPMLRRIEEANPGRVHVRFLDRDLHHDLSERIIICGGLRVPTALFMNEDFEFVGLLGDRTLTRYRAMAARQLGPACPIPGAPIPEDELAGTISDWIEEFERVQLLLRLSPKLRERYRD